MKIKFKVTSVSKRQDGFHVQLEPLSASGTLRIVTESELYSVGDIFYLGEVNG